MSLVKTVGGVKLPIANCIGPECEYEPYGTVLPTAHHTVSAKREGPQSIKLYARKRRPLCHATPAVITERTLRTSSEMSAGMNLPIAEPRATGYKYSMSHLKKI